jgi:hypothetical protein
MERRHSIGWPARLQFPAGRYPFSCYSVAFPLTILDGSRAHGVDFGYSYLAYLLGELCYVVSHVGSPSTTDINASVATRVLPRRC